MDIVNFKTPAGLSKETVSKKSCITPKIFVERFYEIIGEWQIFSPKINQNNILKIFLVL
jgi:hypothetical protein